MLLHFLSLAYFFNPISILLYSSNSLSSFYFDSLLVSSDNVLARHLAETTLSSRAAQPPWPMSRVMGWSASPVTQTFPLLTFL